jgi:hypothetical protein
MLWNVMADLIGSDQLVPWEKDGPLEAGHDEE